MLHLVFRKSAPFLNQKRTGWLLVLLALAGLAPLTGCNRSDGKADPAAAALAPAALPVTRLTARDTTITHEYVAEIQSLRNVDVRSRVGGFITAILVDEGQRVTKGQVLFRLNDAALRTRAASAAAAVSNARAQVRVEELQLDRVQLLTDKDIISKSELDVARAKLAAARATETEARAVAAAAALELGYVQIRAPFDGVIDRIPLREGSEVEDGTLVTSISDTRAAYAYFNVSENEYLRYAKELARDTAAAAAVRTAHLLLADGSEYANLGRVETVQSEFEGSTGSIAFRARFPNPDRLLRHGATGKVRLTNPLPKAVLVPQTAVFEVQEHNYVYVLTKNGTVQQRAFVPQARLGPYYVVASGLLPGEVVVVEGTQELREGDRIRPRYVPLLVAEPTAAVLPSGEPDAVAP